MSIRTSVHTQKVSSISMKYGTWVEVDDCCMTVCSMTQSKVKVTSPRKSEIPLYSNSVVTVTETATET